MTPCSQVVTVALTGWLGGGGGGAPPSVEEEDGGGGGLGRPPEETGE